MSSQTAQLQQTPLQLPTNAGVNLQNFAAVRFEFPSQGRRVQILGLDITDTTLQQASHWIIKQAQDKAPTNVGFVNAHFVNLIHEQPALQRIIDQFDCLYADGIGVKFAGRVHGIRLTDNVNGTDLFPILCRQAASAKVAMFLLGGQTGIAAKAAKAATKMQSSTSGLNVVGTASGHFADRDDEQRVINEINASGAEILLVGMGMPIQEDWIAQNRHRLAPSVIIAVGGLFDFYSGRIRRAPKFLRANGLEWAWRLAMEPRRLFSRYVIGNAKFLIRLAVHRICSPVSGRQQQSTSQ